MNYFIWGGVNSFDMGLRIQSKNVFSSPKRDLNFQSVNGRNGDLIVSNNRYENVDVSYTVFVAAKTISELADKITAIKQWLYSSADGYSRLEDSYDDKFFRCAVFSKALDIEDELNKIGVFTINFSCKPFRYAKSGEEEIVFTSFPFTVSNPYTFESLPYIKIEGDGTSALILQNQASNSVWNFTSVDEYLEIDSEQMSFYKGTTLKNDTVTGESFPTLKSGETILFVGDNIKKVTIIPRWCCL